MNGLRYEEHSLSAFAPLRLCEPVFCLYVPKTNESVAVKSPFSSVLVKVRQGRCGGVAEAKETLRADMQAPRMEMRAGLDRISAEIREVRTDLKLHEMEHHK